MDPLSIAASIAGIVGVCLQAAGSLDALRSKFQHAQVTITALASQCRAIKTGLSRLQMVTVQNHAIRNQDDIIHTMDTTLTGCMVVLSCFDNTLEKLCKAGTGAKRSLITRWRNKARVVWNEDEMKGYISLLQGQQSSVAFLVQLLQM
ncbi:hypothetical protein N7481_007693 [Penicillium waksmanii]|uniref:uncharacterized protein n=1 Tax=Penicillium waksmanii TaxID=69791 RepID=UPI0025465FD6|nr:uncharacterized protein N7481_007693 [Penicillium waksmanii]KAJ5980395.1 hypothetical protein N7481_007693 [Penicillium waksmanii]